MLSIPFNRKQFGNFSNYNISTDGGVLLLDKIESKFSIVKDAAKLVRDVRNPDFITHTMESMMKQLIYGICMGYSDLNDHENIRLDELYKSVFNKSEDLASDSTLCRLEKNIDYDTIVNLNKLLLEKFISSFKLPPKELILDIDATDIELHGNQENRAYNGYYQEYCYLPLHFTCNDDLLISYLRPSNIDGFKHSWPIIGLLIKRIKQSFPDVNIVIRGDSGFMRHKFLGWLELKNIDYIVGMARNSRLSKQVEDDIKSVEAIYDKNLNENKESQTISNYKSFNYKANSWTKERKIISKIEKNYHGQNIRFCITNIDSKKIRIKSLYRDIYCQRGDMENKIKYVQLDFFGHRLSSSKYISNSFRLMLSSLSYLLIHKFKINYLKFTDLANATGNTIRLRLLKLATLIKVNKTSVRFEFTANYKYKNIFKILLPKLFAT